jgi:hypothetical protein
VNERPLQAALRREKRRPGLHASRDVVGQRLPAIAYRLRGLEQLLRDLYQVPGVVRVGLPARSALKVDKLQLPLLLHEGSRHQTARQGAEAATVDSRGLRADAATGWFSRARPRNGPGKKFRPLGGACTKRKRGPPVRANSLSSAPGVRTHWMRPIGAPGRSARDNAAVLSGRPPPRTTGAACYGQRTANGERSGAKTTGNARFGAGCRPAAFFFPPAPLRPRPSV